MITCPTCGAQNDPANRFCDQCGTRLEAAAPAAAAPAPIAAAVNCPSCGATVLPGEAFCDNCGADLTALAVVPAPVISADAAPTPAVAGTAPLPGAGGPASCPVCGSPTIPGERYCDNCGADLQALPAPAVSPNDATMVAPPAAPDDATLIAGTAPVEAAPAPIEAEAAPAPIEAAQTPIEAEAAPAPIEAEAAPTPVEAAPTPVEAAPTPVEAAPVPVEAAPVEAAPIEPEAAPAPVEAAPIEPEAAPAPVEAAPIEPEAAPAPGGSGDAGAERKRLEDLVAAHRETVAQYEQMAARYPADSPPVFIAAGLEEAKRALAQAEADLAAFDAAPAGPDPAEVARVEQLVRAHRETVAQYEQMAARYPAGSVPAFLTAGLEEAQRAQAQAEAELSALLGGTAPAAPAAAPVAAAPTPAAPATTPTPPAAPAAPASPGPRLVMADGQVIMLPGDKAEIIVGREDPVSNIFPEVDLTPHGGEQGGVSRQHARITHVGDQWALTDLNSTNYSRVDGVRAEPNVPLPLHDGAKIQFGRVVATFHL